MNIKKRLGKEEVLEVAPAKKKELNKFRVNEDDTIELLRLIPVVYEVLDSVMDRKYPYEEVLVDGNFSGLKVDLDYSELKRRNFKIGFKKKAQLITTLLPELMETLSQKNKDFYVLKGLRCAEVDGVVYIGSDYSENTILITYVNDKLYSVLIDKVTEPFEFERGVRDSLVEETYSDEVEDTTSEEDAETLEALRKKDIYDRLINTTNEILIESLEDESKTDAVVNDLEKDESVKKEAKKLTSENISLDNLSKEEKKRLEDEVLEHLNSL